MVEHAIRSQSGRASSINPLHSHSGWVGATSNKGCTPPDTIVLSSDTQFDANLSRCTMPSVLADLLEAEEVLIRNTKVEGTFFIEIMAGECVITLGVLLMRIPCLKPWDLIYGESWNVLTHSEILIDLARKSRIDPFLGLPCQSFTFARDPALRVAENPMGKPGLSPRQQELLDLGNKLAAWSLSFVQTIQTAGGYFTVENPFLSWLCWLPAATKVLRMDHAQKHILPAQQSSATYDWNLRRTLSKIKHCSPWAMFVQGQTSIAHKVITKLHLRDLQKLTVS